MEIMNMQTAKSNETNNATKGVIKWDSFLLFLPGSQNSHVQLVDDQNRIWSDIPRGDVMKVIDKQMTCKMFHDWRQLTVIIDGKPAETIYKFDNIDEFKVDNFTSVRYKVEEIFDLEDKPQEIESDVNEIIEVDAKVIE